MTERKTDKERKVVREIFCVQAAGKKYECTVSKSVCDNDPLCIVNFNREIQLAEKDKIVHTNRIDGEPHF